MILPGFLIILKIVSIVISSWVLIHLLAAFGVFLAFAYPFWWFISPRSTVCLNCQARKEGSWCSFCKSVIEPGDKHPSNFKSAILNSFLILTFSVISIGVITIEYKILSKLDLFPINKSVEFIIPDKRKYKIGEIFPLDVQVSGIETPINAIQVDISFDPDLLEVVEISTEGSFATVFIEKEINNDFGFARLTGGLPNPGYDLPSGLFGTVFLRGKKPGFAEVNFLPTSVVLANDSRGSNVLKSIPTASFLILDETIKGDQPNLSDQVFLKTNVLGSTAEDEQLHLYLSNKIADATTDNVINNVSSNNYNESRDSAYEMPLFENFLVLIRDVDARIINIFE